MSEREIYLNHASYGRASAPVLERMRAYLAREEEIGPDRAQAEVGEELAALRQNAARLLGTETRRIGFGGTTAALWIETAGRLALAGRRVLVAPHEWHADIRALEDMGARVEVLPELDPDEPDLAPWSSRIDDDVAMIAVPMVTSCAGLLYPVEEIGHLPRPKDCILMVDGAQALGQMEISVDDIGCDAFFATTRKWLRGPRQTALFWMSDWLAGQIPPARIERGDFNVALRLGQGAAVAEAVAGLPERIAALRAISAHIREGAERLGLRVLSTPANGTTAITLGLPPEAKSATDAALIRAGIIAKWTDPVGEEPKSALAAEVASGGCAPLRISPHVLTTPDEIDLMFETLAASL